MIDDPSQYLTLGGGAALFIFLVKTMIDQTRDYRGIIEAQRNEAKEAKYEASDALARAAHAEHLVSQCEAHRQIDQDRMRVMEEKITVLQARLSVHESGEGSGA
jgi:hypothetical protein